MEKDPFAGATGIGSSSQPPSPPDKGVTELSKILDRISAHNSALATERGRLKSSIDKALGTIPSDEADKAAVNKDGPYLQAIDAMLTEQARIIQGLNEQLDRLETII